VDARHRALRRVGDDRGAQAGWRQGLLWSVVLLVSCEQVTWRDVDAQLRPFVARRVEASDVDDILQDVFVRMRRGLAALRDDERMSAWLFQIARSAIADHGRARARHPLVIGDDRSPDAAAPDDGADDDRDVSRAMAGCVAMFVAQLASPYREAVTLVELEGLTAREAAQMADVSLSGMKSRVQRGRAQLREMFEGCCKLELDARRKVTECEPRPAGGAPRTRGCG
jgi:RNA polymerase sigma-70 factor (ECF subfamily)